MYKIISVFLVLLIIQTKVAAKNALYVSSTGNDQFIGSLRFPLRTIDSALVRSRKEKIRMIILRGGTYYNLSLHITKFDSNLVIRNYKKEKVTLSGGIPLTSFEKQGNLLVASLPETISVNDFQIIIVNGILRQHSRLPEQGSFEYLNEWNVKSRPSFYGTWERKPTKEESSVLKCAPTDLAIWKDNSGNAEISLSHQWSESYSSVDSVNSRQNLIYLHYLTDMPLGSYGHKSYVVWNTKEGMIHAGQWYVDKTKRKIYYWQLPGENVHEILLPAHRNIIIFEKGVQNVTLNGFTLSAAGNKLQKEDFACTSIDPLILGSLVNNIRIEHLKIIQTNGSGIRLKGRHNRISDVDIRECGGGGIYFAGEDITIENCQLDSLCMLFQGAVGIQGNGKRAYISHCSITNTPYSGMCLTLDSSIIKDCIIKETMKELSDGGAIYCNGSNHVCLDHNYIFNNNTTRFTMGIYFDEQSRDCIAQNNIVVNSGIPIHCHMAQNILYQKNLFIDKLKQTINSGGSSGLSLNGNIFLASIIQFNGPSAFDKQTDTLKLEPKYRKYANPTGITSFRKNLLLHISANETKLPHIEQAASSGTVVKYINKNMKNTISYLLNNKKLRQYINKSLGLTHYNIKEIETLVQ